MNHLINRKNIVAVFVLSALLFLTNSSALAQRYSAWSAPQNLGATINTTALEGCPFIAPDNLSLFFASDRTGGAGGVDIWVTTRASVNALWGTPVNLGTNINTSGTEFCPTLIAGGLTLYFVSDKPGGCGGNDIYVSQRLNNQGEWGPALNLGCQFNSPQSDITPTLFTDNTGTTYLYISSTRPGGPGLMDIYVSTLQPNGAFGAPVLVEGLNSASNDQRPNIRVRDGLEFFFESDRPGTLGSTDLYVSTRAGNSAPWSTPENLGATVNSVSAEGRPSLSFDGRDLYFMSTRSGGFGSNDIFVVRRSTFTPSDFDGDGRADVSVFRPSDRVWYLLRSGSGFSATQFGLSTDRIVPADYDGDGRTDLAVYRDGTWWILQSSNGNVLIRQFGLSGDIPQPADFDGDGKAEIAVYRNGVWWTLNLINNQVNVVQFGIATDKPVAADYDGDGRADYAVYRDGVWHLLRSQSGNTAIYFGSSSDKPVPADYDGDGKTDVAVYRSGVWYVLGSRDGFTGFQFGLPTDIPAAADYDGDGKADAAVYRDGIWYQLKSSQGFAAVQFGLTNDKPIPNAFVP